MKAKITYTMKDLAALVEKQVSKDFSAPTGYKWAVAEEYSEIRAELVKIEETEQAEQAEERLSFHPG
jgi:hypothetical protein